MGAAGVEGELGLSRRRAHVVAAYRRHRLEPPPPEVHSRWQVRRRPLRLFWRPFWLRFTYDTPVLVKKY
jgi:hypothetical protein